MVNVPFLSRQPRTRVPIDHTNPITRGLGFCWNPALTRQLSGTAGPQSFHVFDRPLGVNDDTTTIRIGSFDLAQGSLTPNRYQDMLGCRTGSATPAVINLDTGSGEPFDPYSHDWSVLAIIWFHDLTSDAMIMSWQDVSGVFQVWADTNSTQLRLQVFDGASTFGSYGDLDDTRPYVICLTYDDSATTITGYIDGIQNLQDTGFSNSNPADTALRINNVGKDADQTTFLYALWDRPLSALEARSLGANPWQILRPEANETFELAATPSVVAPRMQIASYG